MDRRGIGSVQVDGLRILMFLRIRTNTESTREQNHISQDLNADKRSKNLNINSRYLRPQTPAPPKSNLLQIWEFLTTWIRRSASTNIHPCFWLPQQILKKPRSKSPGFRYARQRLFHRNRRLESLLCFPTLRGAQALQIEGLPMITLHSGSTMCCLGSTARVGCQLYP